MLVSKYCIAFGFMGTGWEAFFIQLVESHRHETGFAVALRTIQGSDNPNMIEALILPTV